MFKLDRRRCRVGEPGPAYSLEDVLDKLDLCGIDVSAKELVLVVERGGKREAVRRFANTALGHQELKRYLTRGRARVRVCMESTGLYGLDLAQMLHADTRIEIMVANPRAVRNFAQALFQRSKNDPLDAGVLVEFARRMPFQAWQPPSRRALELTALARRIHALTEQATMEKNRLHAVSAIAAALRVVVQDLRRSIRTLERAQVRLAREAKKIIALDPQLRQRFSLLLSIPGVGEISALHLLGELALIPPQADVRQWVAYAGLDPREYSSGSSVEKRTRISKVGNRHIRRALYMPALTAAHHHPVFQDHYQRLQARGKCKMVALVAIMRKLLHAIFGMLKHSAVFDGSKLYPSFSPKEPATRAA